jgi:hypothetical protein
VHQFLLKQEQKTKRPKRITTMKQQFSLALFREEERQRRRNRSADNQSRGAPPILEISANLTRSASPARRSARASKQINKQSARHLSLSWFHHLATPIGERALRVI